PAHGYRGASELQNRQAPSIKENRHPRVHRQLAPGGERPMSATKEEAPGGQTGGPVRSRQSADNGPVISSIVSDHDAIARYLNAVYGTENEGFAFIGHYAPGGTFK